MLQQKLLLGALLVCSAYAQASDDHYKSFTRHCGKKLMKHLCTDEPRNFDNTFLQEFPTCNRPNKLDVLNESLMMTRKSIRLQQCLPTLLLLSSLADYCNESFPSDRTNEVAKHYNRLQSLQKFKVTKKIEAEISLELDLINQQLMIRNSLEAAAINAEKQKVRAQEFDIIRNQLMPS